MISIPIPVRVSCDDVSTSRITCGGGVESGDLGLNLAHLTGRLRLPISSSEGRLGRLESLNRLLLLRLAEDDHILMLTVHHIVFDVWSLGVMQRELSTLYAGFTREEPASLAELPVQYTDFAAWQHHCVDGEPLEWQVAQLAVSTGCNVVSKAASETPGGSG